MHTRVGLYLRISRDDGTTLAVERQEAECRAKASSLGWTITHTYTDQGKSASSKKVTRPEYNRMLSDAQAGVIDGVITWSHDRLTRQPEQLGAWLDLADTGFKLATVSGELDLGSDSGRLSARIFVAVAEQEVRRKGARQAAANRQRAEMGLPLSRQRAFGYNADNMTLHPVEAPLIKEAVDGVLAGTHTINGIASQWNRQGIPTTYGNKWQRINVKRILTSDRIAGILRYKGSEVFAAKWTPIITTDNLQAVRSLLEAPERHSQTKGSAVSNLLSYLMVCECGSPVCAMTGNRGVRTYRCTNTNCFRTINRDNADQRVAKAVASTLASPGFRSPKAVDDIKQLRDELVKVNEETQALTQMYEAREIDLAQFKRMNSGSAAERIKLEDAINAVMEKDATAKLINDLALRKSGIIGNTVQAISDNAETILERFGSYELEQQRIIIKGLFSSITMLPAASGGRQTEEATRKRIVIEGETEIIW